MAKLKIYESELGVKEAKTPAIGQALSLPFVIAEQQGVAVKSFFKSITDIRDAQKATKDQNQAEDAILILDQDIDKKFKNYQLSTDGDDAIRFINSIDKNNYSTQLKRLSKGAKRIVSNHLFLRQKELGLKLAGKISVNHITETKNKHQSKLDRIVSRMAFNDPIARDNAYKEFESFFKDPLNAEKYLPTEFNKLYNDKRKDARRLQLKAGIRNDHWFILNKAKEIKKEFGDVEGELLLNEAKTRAVSKMASVDLDQMRMAEAASDEKIANFAEILVRINNTDNPDYLGEVPTLDHVADMFKLDQINSGQYAALIDFYARGHKVSDQQLVDKIDAQLVMAESIEDIDILEKSINFDGNLIQKLNLKDAQGYKEIFERYKKDQPGFTDYKHFFDMLETDLAKLEAGQASVFYASKGPTLEERQEVQRIRQNGLKLYKDLVRKNIDPSDAYIQVLNTQMNEKTMPSIYNIVPFQSGMRLQKPKTGTDPKEFFTNKRNELAAMYKSGLIDIDTFMNDTNNMDTVEDLFELRMSLMKDNADQAFSEAIPRKEGSKRKQN